jgi:hypothetical protein
MTPDDNAFNLASWTDFNSAPSQTFDVIPAGTILPVVMTIRPGGYDDPAQGWTGGYATFGRTGAIYLSCEFTVIEGQYAKRKIWTNIGLFSPKGPEWANMGRAFVRNILNSARGLGDKDNSPQAVAARRITGFHDLDGLEFLAKLGVGKDVNDEQKNEVRIAIPADHRDWARYYETGGTWQPRGHVQQYAPGQTQQYAPGLTAGMLAEPGQTQAGAAQRTFAIHPTMPTAAPPPEMMEGSGALPAPVAPQPPGAASNRPSWAR